ncbi:MAG: hypothetical protein HY075_09530 [Deltaproteobacteria bacterium]|nr:hypothetical protein [Deltaproteobacteria bacterium]
MIALLLSLAAAAWAGIPVDDGAYELVAVVERCAPSPSGKSAGLCAIVGKGTRSQRVLSLKPSPWDESLRSAPGLRLILRGSLKGSGFTIEQAPKIHRETVDELIAAPDPMKKL